MRGRRWIAALAAGGLAASGALALFAYPGENAAEARQPTKLHPKRGTAPEERITLRSAPYRLDFFPAPGATSEGIVLMAHGGGWRGNPTPGAHDKVGFWIHKVHGFGYDVASVAYRDRALSLPDTLAAFDELRAEFPDREICTFGPSAGAHLSLMVAARRGAKLACVVALSGPPNLEFWGKDSDPNGRRLAIAAFGRKRLRALSPIRHSRRIRARVLVAGSPCDKLISWRQQKLFVAKLDRAGAGARLHSFEYGRYSSLPHCSVDRPSFNGFLAKKKRILRAALGPVERSEPGSGDARARR